MSYTANRLDKVVNTLTDLRNRGQWYLTQIVPHAAIRKIDLGTNGNGYGHLLKHLKNVPAGVASKYLAGREGRELADMIAAEVLKKGDNWNLKLNQFVVENLNDPSLKGGKDLEIISGYYGPFFGRQEMDVPDIARKLKMGDSEVVMRLDELDRDFFVEMTEHLDTPPYNRRKEDPRSA